MSRFDWLSEYMARLQDEHVLIRRGSSAALAPAHVLEIDAEDWGRTAQLAKDFGCRWAGCWGDHQQTDIRIFVCFEYEGDYLLLNTLIDLARPVIASHTPFFPVADRPERHIQDLLGVAFMDHKDHRRWTRHQAWDDASYPLRNDFPLQGTPAEVTPADGEYAFHKIKGAGVYEIPVGPVHAGIIEPGHFRFNAVGEEVLSLEQHLGYVHKGIEKLAVGRDPASLVQLAARVSGDATVAHSWAACQAIERASGCRLPVRAQQLRGLLCERERVANHLGDIGAICNDVGFAFGHYQCARLREQWQRRSDAIFAHRMMMDSVIAGGVSCDIDSNNINDLKADHAKLRKEITPLFDLLQDIASLEDRLLNTGILTQQTAQTLGCTGYVGKASGLAFDARSQLRYPPYDTQPIDTPVLQAGDVMARMQIRMQEVETSLDWMDTLLGRLHNDGIFVDLPEVTNVTQGFGVVESWRGEILCYVRLDENGKIARYFPRDPSWHSWPALQQIVLGNIVPDFPVCNKSVNGSYSGHDL